MSGSICGGAIVLTVLLALVAGGGGGQPCSGREGDRALALVSEMRDDDQQSWKMLSLPSWSKRLVGAVQTSRRKFQSCRTV